MIVYVVEDRWDDGDWTPTSQQYLDARQAHKAARHSNEARRLPNVRYRVSVYKRVSVAEVEVSS